MYLFVPVLAALGLGVWCLGVWTRDCIMIIAATPCHVGRDIVCTVSDESTRLYYFCIFIPVWISYHA